MKKYTGNCSEGDQYENDQIFRGIIRMCERVAASGGTPTPYSA